MTHDIAKIDNYSVYRRLGNIKDITQRTKIFQYCTCPAGRVTYNFHLSCKHMHFSFKSVGIKNLRE